MADRGGNVEDQDVLLIDFMEDLSATRKLAEMLDQEDSIVRGWVDLAYKFQLPSDTIDKLRSSGLKDGGPSKAFFSHLLCVRDTETLGDFKSKCKLLNRNDVVLYLQGESDEKRLNSLDEDMLDFLAVKFSSSSCISSWRDLAGMYNLTYSEVKAIETHCDRKERNSPTLKLLEALTGNNEKISLTEVIKHLRVIHRNDAAEYLQEVKQKHLKYGQKTST